MTERPSPVSRASPFHRTHHSHRTALVTAPPASRLASQLPLPRRTDLRHPTHRVEPTTHRTFVGISSVLLVPS